MSEISNQPEPVDVLDSTSTDASPEWGVSAPKGGRTVVNRALKDGARVPLFLGQTLINSLRDLGYNSTTSALCEHVDNALQWGAKEVRVYFRQTGKQPNQQIDALVYDNGKGMAPHVLKVAMAFGGSMVYDNRTGIGRYGMGMKAAALNIARSVDVYSWQEPGANYSMTLDVDEIGRDRNNMIELPDPQLTDALPTEIAEILTKIMSYPKAASEQDRLAESAEELDDSLGKSGTIVYLPQCDRLTFSTAKGLCDHAVKELSRVYRRFIGEGVRIYVNNRSIEAFDPTYWMPTARHTKIVQELEEKKSRLFDSWAVQVPISEGSPNMTEVRVRMYVLPVDSWGSLTRETLKNKLHVYDDHTVSYIRNAREVEIGAEPRLKLNKHHTNAWLRVEIEFTAEADEVFGVAANKQGVRLQQVAADEILRHDDGRFSKNITAIRKSIREKQLKASTAEQAGQSGEAERYATESDSIQAVSLPAPPADTAEQKAALEANLYGLAVSLKQEKETDEQAFDRVKKSKYLVDLKHEQYAPFYDTEYKFGKLILRVNTAHPFYQKVWQPLTDLAKKTAAATNGDDDDMAEGGMTEATCKPLLGLQLMLLSLARAQTQMSSGDDGETQLQLFRNLRKSWSDILETQFQHV